MILKNSVISEIKKSNNPIRIGIIDTIVTCVEEQNLLLYIPARVAILSWHFKERI